MLKWLQPEGIHFEHFTIASADAGFRRYFRLHKQDSSLIAVDAPPEYEDTNAFIDIADRLAKSGLRVPKIHCYSSEMGFLVIEDFGARHLQQVIESDKQEKALAAPLYHQAMTAIERMQGQTITTQLPVCDSRFLLSELELFPEWYLKVHRNIDLNTNQRDIVKRTFNLLIESATEQPYRFMHRDYHCRNLMVPDETTLGIIDFQGAMLGPVTYDPVSLLTDVYVKLPTDLQEQLKAQHRATLAPETNPHTYQQWFDWMGLQRHLKILGLFCRLKYRDNKPHYLNHLPTVIGHIDNTLARYPEMTEFYTLFKQLHSADSIT